MYITFDEVMSFKREIDELKADNISLFKRLNDANKGTLKGILKERVKHYPKEYKDEARDYFHHNPQCKKLLFFMIDGNNFDDDGCYNAYLLDDECIAKIDNS